MIRSARPPRRTGARALSRRGTRDDDRGATSVELVLYTPLIMFMTFLIIQFALSWYGNEVAGAVARETARVARAGGGEASAYQDAHQRGLEYADALGQRGLRDVTIVITPLPAEEEVRVTVSGRSMEIIRGFAPRVSATVEGPLETFRPDL